MSPLFTDSTGLPVPILLGGGLTQPGSAQSYSWLCAQEVLGRASLPLSSMCHKEGAVIPIFSLGLRCLISSQVRPHLTLCPFYLPTFTQAQCSCRPYCWPRFLTFPPWRYLVVLRVSSWSRAQVSLLNGLKGPYLVLSYHCSPRSQGADPPKPVFKLTLVCSKSRVAPCISFLEGRNLRCSGAGSGNDTEAQTQDP